MTEFVLEKNHISPECRANRGDHGAFDEAVDRLRKVYDVQIARFPDATVSVGMSMKRDLHTWLLVSDDDPEQTKVCRRCGAQRNRRGPIAERAVISGGWPESDCEGES